MSRLRTVSPNDKGWTRKRSGRGFRYVDEKGEPLSETRVERIKALVIPPAWSEVWICPYANGHLQAVGTDDAGRRQYLYHPQWRADQDQAKFERVQRVAKRLPKVREAVRRDMRRDDLPREKACAVAVRLLDVGLFRIGGESTGEVESFGLTTLQPRHVSMRGDTLLFSFVGKSGIEHEIEVEDNAVTEALVPMRRRKEAAQLLAWKDGRRWVELHAADVNSYLHELAGEDFTAKDFRTWHATVHAAVALATSDQAGDTDASRRRAIRAAMVEVSEYLGNTPAIAKASYVDPRVVDLYEDGVTIAAAARKRYRNANSRQAALERAVLRLLSRAPESGGRDTRSRTRTKKP